MKKLSHTLEISVALALLKTDLGPTDPIRIDVLSYPGAVQTMSYNMLYLPVLASVMSKLKPGNRMRSNNAMNRNEI